MHNLLWNNKPHLWLEGFGPMSWPAFVVKAPISFVQHFMSHKSLSSMGQSGVMDEWGWTSDGGLFWGQLRSYDPSWQWEGGTKRGCGERSGSLLAIKRIIYSRGRSLVYGQQTLMWSLFYDPTTRDLVIWSLLAVEACADRDMPSLPLGRSCHRAKMASCLPS